LILTGADFAILRSTSKLGSISVLIAAPARRTLED
jgi:hypothetical protein